MNLLRWSSANAKTHHLAATLGIPKTAMVGLSLPSGFTCPGASICLSRAVKDKESGKLTVKDGHGCEFRCYSATLEARFRNVYKLVNHNFSALKAAGLRDVPALSGLINQSIDGYKRGTIRVIRLHVHGDFLTREYMQSWLRVARNRPEIQVYGYTKSLKFWASLRDQSPPNFRLVASIGGKYDSLIAEHSMVSARVVYSEQEAESLGLEIDHDESLAFACNRDYALLLHGTQPAGSSAAMALEALKQSGFTGYNRN